MEVLIDSLALCQYQKTVNESFACLLSLSAEESKYKQRSGHCVQKEEMTETTGIPLCSVYLQSAGLQIKG